MVNLQYWHLSNIKTKHFDQHHINVLTVQGGLCLIILVRSPAMSSGTPATSFVHQKVIVCKHSHCEHGGPCTRVQLCAQHRLSGPGGFLRRGQSQSMAPNRTEVMADAA